MKKQGETAIRVEYLDAGKKRTPDQQMQAIRGVSIDVSIHRPHTRPDQIHHHALLYPSGFNSQASYEARP